MGLHRRILRKRREQGWKHRVSGGNLLPPLWGWRSMALPEIHMVSGSCKTSPVLLPPVPIRADIVGATWHIL